MKLNTIHSDARGAISLLTEDMKYPEVTVFHTKKGFARGGCIHDLSDEYTCVIEGEVEYRIGDKVLKMKDGESAIITRNTPHYYVSLTDSIVLEWGATPAEKQNKHLEFRAIVDEINAKRQN